MSDNTMPKNDLVVPEALRKDSLAPPAAGLQLQGRVAQLWKRFGDRKQVASIIKEIDAIDFHGRFDSREKIVAALQRYSILHGGEAARVELEALKARLAGVDPFPIYKHVLKLSGDSPEEIVRWVRSGILHVDSSPSVMQGEQGERPFTPLETLICGVGQCTGFATLASALIDAAGYEARLWGVPGHTFLEWRTPKGRWQVEDVDFLPANVPMPRGLSMRSLFESYQEWVPLLDSLPCLNALVRAHCFVPTDGAPLTGWQIDRNEPTRYVYLENFTCGSVEREKRAVGLKGVDAETATLSVDNYNPTPRVLLVCEGRSGLVETQFDEKGLQHDVFMFRRAKGLYDEHIKNAPRRLYALIPGSARDFPVSLADFAGKEISAFALPYGNIMANPFFLTDSLKVPALAPDSPVLQDGGEEEHYSYHPLIDDAQAAFDSVLNAEDGSIDKAAAGHAVEVQPKLTARLIDQLDLPPFKGRVLDAGCGTGGFTVALARDADSIAAVDYTAGRIDFFNAVLDRMNTRPPIETLAGPIEDMPFQDGEFDAIYCRGVIWVADTPRAIQEFFRVLKPGGRVYMTNNDDAWNHYLVEGKGEENPNAARQGRDTLYNTAWRRHGKAAMEALQGVLKNASVDIDLDDEAISLDELLDEMDRLLRAAPSEAATTVRRLELHARALCGEGHLPVILRDMLAVASGKQAGPTVSVSSDSWSPEDVEALVHGIGYTNFVWWSGGGGQDEHGKRPLELGPWPDGKVRSHWYQLGIRHRHYRGALTTWHCMYEKPA